MGETIAEVIIRLIFELVFYGLFYWTGYLLLKIVSLGKIRVAPLMTIGDKNRSKKKWYQIDWDIWLHQPMKGRSLKAECACFVGMLGWIVAGILIYHGTR